MGFFSNFKPSAKPKGAVDVVAPVWRKILNSYPDMSSFDIAREFISMRPVQFRDQITAHLNYQESTGYPSFRPSSFVWIILDVELGIKPGILTDKMEQEWDDIISDGLGEYGLN